MIATLEQLVSGGKRAVAVALAQIESDPYASQTLSLLAEAYSSPRAHVLGITGPPGVGKSTLINTIIARFRAEGKTVGCIAIDPTSRRSGGALLGDRIRFAVDPEDQGVFIRSMAARDRLGGLAGLTAAAMVLMRAIYDVVLIETVGVGQSETDISGVADSVIFCVQPGSGDSIQFMKAGIAEIPDLVIVTKADIGKQAIRAQADMIGALSLAEEGDDDWQTPVLLVAAMDGQGIYRVLETLAQHYAWLQLNDRLMERRLEQSQSWIKEWVYEEFGRHGLNNMAALPFVSSVSPFDRIAFLRGSLSVSL